MSVTIAQFIDLLEKVCSSLHIVYLDNLKQKHPSADTQLYFFVEMKSWIPRLKCEDEKKTVEEVLEKDFEFSVFFTLITNIGIKASDIVWSVERHRDKKYRELTRPYNYSWSDMSHLLKKVSPKVSQETEEKIYTRMKSLHQEKLKYYFTKNFYIF